MSAPPWTIPPDRCRFYPDHIWVRCEQRRLRDMFRRTFVWLCCECSAKATTEPREYPFGA